MIVVVDDHRAQSADNPSAPDPTERPINFLLRRAASTRILDDLDDSLC